MVAVDYAGQLAEMEKIATIAREQGAFVIEDASHAVGSWFTKGIDKHRVGSHPWADATVFSFHPVKTITAGEGGMISTNDGDLAARLKMLRHHGITKDASVFLNDDREGVLSEKGRWYHEMQDLGFNYRITDLQCALGRSQLEKLDRFVTRRAEIVSLYNEAFAGNEYIETPSIAPWLDDSGDFCISWHLYSLELDFESIGKSRDQIMGELQEEGIGTQVLYIPIHLQPWYQKTYGYCAGMYPVAEAFYQKTLSLPLYASLSNEEIGFIVESLLKIIE